MSKKILKRSLALGALMAFVITGSAWAWETHIVHEKHSNWKVKETFYVFGEEGLKENANFEISDLVSYNGVKCGHEGCGEYDYNTYDPVAPDTYVFNLNDKTFTVDGGIYIGGDILQVNGIAGSNLVASYLTYSSGSSINVDELNITNSSGNAIYRPEADENSPNITGSANINANKVVLDASNHAFQIHNDLFVGKDKPVGVLEITAGGKAFNVAQYNTKTGVGATLEIYANKLDVIKTTRASKAYGGSTLIVEAQEGNIATDFETDSTGTVDLKFGSGVNWTGKLYAEDGATKTALDLSGTWNLKDDVTDIQNKANSLTNATFRKGSTFVIDGATYEASKGVYALNGVGDKATLTVEEGAKIVITDGVVDGVYNVAKDFATNEGANWTLQANNALWYVDWNLDETANTLQGTILAKTAEDMVDTGVATNENKEIMLEIATAPAGENATADAINELASSDNVTAEDIQKGAAALLQVGEAGGFTGNVVSVSKQVNGSVGARNSFSGPKHGGPRHRGGHGPSVTEEANGSAIWAQYVHGKDKVDGIDMGGVENAYESQFNGVVLGADFKQVGSYASGIAFNYGEGDSHSKKNVVQSDSEFDFWGVSYYGAVKKQDTNFIFDIGYSESDSDVEQKFGGNTITANPEASTWTAGVKVEKLIDKGAVQIVPYAGLRFLTIDTDDYEAKGGTASEATYYSTERQNIWLLPVGVSLSQENVYDSGWIVTPKADLSYTWAMGDTDSSMTVNMPGVASPTTLGYTVMDDGSFMATVGLDAQKEDWTFGVAYSYQKGDSTRSDRWYVNARYSF